MTVEEYAREVGLYVATWAPGDGVRRYRFLTRPNSYFGPDDGLFTALGRKEAMVWLRGYRQGRKGQ